MTIHVSLDTNPPPGTAPVSVNHDIYHVNRGNQTITWKRSSNQTFTFTSLTGLTENPPFLPPPTVTDDEITLGDNNQNNGPEVFYAYTIVVTLNNVQYSTNPPGNPTAQSTGPVIGNR